MAPKGSPKKVLTNEDKVKIGSILDNDGFFRQHDHSKATKKIVKAFEDNGNTIIIKY